MEGFIITSLPISVDGKKEYLSQKSMQQMIAELDLSLLEREEKGGKFEAMGGRETIIFRSGSLSASTTAELVAHRLGTADIRVERALDDIAEKIRGDNMSEILEGHGWQILGFLSKKAAELDQRTKWIAIFSHDSLGSVESRVHPGTTLRSTPGALYRFTLNKSYNVPKAGMKYDLEMIEPKENILVRESHTRS